MKHKPQINFFDALGLMPAPPPAPVEPEPLAKREDHRTQVMIETMLACFSNPTIFADHPHSAGPPPMEWLKKQRMLVELERAARLMKLVHDKPEAPLDEIRACATRLTNPEICGILSVISGEVPPGHEVGAEYIRAFAHCVEFDDFMRLFGEMEDEPIRLGDVEHFYQLYGGYKGWGRLDDAERQWIRDFNQKVRTARRERKRR